MLFVQRIWNWCRRFRHRCGYGVHSPSDFFLITSVIYEGLPYYAYKELKGHPLQKSLPHYREKVNRLLFRLVNYFRPSTLIEVGEGNGDAIRYMRSARSSMVSVSLTGLEKEKTMRQLEAELVKMFESVFPYLNEHSCVVVGDIYASKEREAWWKQLTQDERVRISFDLYDVGLLLFENKRFKQNYIVNFF